MNGRDSLSVPRPAPFAAGGRCAIRGDTECSKAPEGGVQNSRQIVMAVEFVTR